MYDWRVAAMAVAAATALLLPCRLPCSIRQFQPACTAGYAL